MTDNFVSVDSIYFGSLENVPDIYKVELDDKILGRSKYKVCSMCGRRWYKGHLMLRLKKRQFNLYCPETKYHIQTPEQYRELILQYDLEDFGKDFKSNKSSIDIRVTGWKSRQARLERMKMNYADNSEVVVDNGKILLPKDHPDYERVKNSFIENNKNIAGKQVDELEIEKKKLIDKANQIAIQQNQIKKDLENDIKELDNDDEV